MDKEFGYYFIYQEYRLVVKPHSQLAAEQIQPVLQSVIQDVVLPSLQNVSAQNIKVSGRKLFFQFHSLSSYESYIDNLQAILSNFKETSNDYYLEQASLILKGTGSALSGPEKYFMREVPALLAGKTGYYACQKLPFVSHITNAVIKDDGEWTVYSLTSGEVKQERELEPVSVKKNLLKVWACIIFLFVVLLPAFRYGWSLYEKSIVTSLASKMNENPEDFLLSVKDIKWSDGVRELVEEWLSREVTASFAKDTGFQEIRDDLSAIKASHRNSEVFQFYSTLMAYEKQLEEGEDAPDTYKLENLFRSAMGSRFRFLALIHFHIWEKGPDPTGLLPWVSKIPGGIKETDSDLLKKLLIRALSFNINGKEGQLIGVIQSYSQFHLLDALVKAFINSELIVVRRNSLRLLIRLKEASLSQVRLYFSERFKTGENFKEDFSLLREFKGHVLSGDLLYALGDSLLELKRREEISKETVEELKQVMDYLKN